MRRWIALAVIASCQSSHAPQPQQQQQAPAKPPMTNDAAVTPVGDRAYVVDASGLVEVSPSASQVIVPGEVSWCNADARANVIWYETTAGLFAFDLQTRASIPIIKGSFEEVEPIIEWGPFGNVDERLGGENKVELRVGIAIGMGSASLAMEIGCEGDAAVYCFEDDGKTPTKDLAAQQKVAKHLALVDRSAIARLAARGASRSLWSPPPVPQSDGKPPKIDKTRCHENPDACGTLLAIPGSSLWLVTTENSRGDYFHETRDLWDPATGEFVKATGSGVARSKQLSADDENTTDYAGMRVSPAGLSHDGLVFDPHRVIYAPKDFGKTCGWSSGGWRIKGGAE
jgi:hypothetical protein